MIRFLLFFWIVTNPAFAPAFAKDRLLVFAAASQKDAMEHIGELYAPICDCEVVFSFAATSTLARQVDAGAEADVIVTANEAWADWLELRGKVDRESRAVIAGNRLVIATSAKTKDRFNILWRGRFAMADPVSVPAGIYAREALESIGIWDKVRKNAVFSENVRVALSSVKRGDLLSGIVYQSDLSLVAGLRQHYVFPANSHAPIHYVALARTKSARAMDFISFLRSDVARDIFSKLGFLNVPAIN